MQVDPAGPRPGADVSCPRAGGLLATFLNRAATTPSGVTTYLITPPTTR